MQALTAKASKAKEKFTFTIYNLHLQTVQLILL